MEEYTNLIALTKLHIAQEYEKKDFLYTDPETFRSFVAFAKETPKKETPRPIAKPKPIEKPKIKPSPPPRKVLQPVKEEPKKEPIKTTELQKSSPPPIDPFDDIKKVLTKLFPRLTILENTPDDSAINIKLAPEVLVFTDELSPLHQKFLSNLTRAIQLCVCPAVALSSKGKRCEAFLSQDQVKLFIALEKTIPGVSKKYPNIKALPLQPIESYFEHPETKATLWESIKQCLNT